MHICFEKELFGLDNSEIMYKSEECGDEIYLRFLEGDRSALEKLIELFAESLTLFINGFINNMIDAEDLMIEAFSRLVVNGKSFSGKSSLKTYLFTIGRNLAFSYLKRLKKEKCLSLEYENFEVAEEVALEMSFLNNERRRELYSAMKGLRSDYREVLYLLYFENMSYKDIGRVLKKNEMQVASFIYRAKLSLKVKLENEGFTYEEF